MRSHAKSTLWSTLFFALLGLMWCGYVAFPTANPAPCATSGCALFRDTKVAGLSLWWVGGAYFFTLAVTCLRGNRALARFLASLALCLDTALLIIMFLTAPCFDCLVVAVLMACCYSTARKPGDGWFNTGDTRPSFLLPVWFGLFLGNAVLATNEQMPLYAMGNTRTSEVSLYFSPSCPACREAMLSLGNSAALYPVEEREGDMEAIIRLGNLLKNNVRVEEALRRSRDPNEPTPYLAFYERWALEMKLMRNKASLLRQGFRALPLIQVNGMPGHKPTPIDRAPVPPAHSGAAGEGPVYDISPPAAAPSPSLDQQSWGNGSLDANNGLPDFLNEPGGLNQCGGESAVPCD